MRLLIHIYVQVCMHVYKCTKINTYIFIYIYIYIIHIYICMYIYIYTYTYTYMYIYIHIYIYVYISINIYIYIIYIALFLNLCSSCAPNSATPSPPSLSNALLLLPVRQGTYRCNKRRCESQRFAAILTCYPGTTL